MIQSFSILLFLVLSAIPNDGIRTVQGFQIAPSNHINTGSVLGKMTRRNIFNARIPQNAIALSPSVRLEMGFFDSFFKSREGDFVKLDSSSQDTIGPGPLIVLYNIPHGIDDEEIGGMIEDGAPIASASEKGVSFIRMYPEDIQGGGDYEDKSVIDLLQTVLPLATSTSNALAINPMKSKTVDPSSCPILYFSGISNSEMMDTYNIIAGEIYQETEGKANAACAKVVEPAFEKRFGQLVEEISGDHKDAMSAASD
jgi:hypothetical protein